MNCEEFEINVNDLARKQLMEAALQDQAVAHRDECEACAQRLEDERALSFKLRMLAADTNALAVPGLGNNLLTTLRSRQAPLRSAEVATWRYRVMDAGAAVAAMVLVVIGVSVIRSRSTTPTVTNRQDLSSPQPLLPDENAIAKAPDVVNGSLPTPLPKRNPSYKGRKDRLDKVRRAVLPSPSLASTGASKYVTVTETAASVAPESVAEITSDFIPVGYASANSFQDGGQLVRVELPRSALVAFGLPINVNRYDEKVKADVFFGTDGTARALRFVQ